MDCAVKGLNQDKRTKRYPIRNTKGRIQEFAKAGAGPSRSLPGPYPLEIGPFKSARGSWGALYASQVGSGAEPGRKRI